jgi:nucleolar MIF4G domain-containing protein 1
MESQHDNNHVLAASRKARRKRERAQAKEQRGRRRHGGKNNKADDDDMNIASVSAQRPAKQKQSEKQQQHQQQQQQREPVSKKQKTTSSEIRGNVKSKPQKKDASKKNKQEKQDMVGDPYAGLSPDVAAALRREDAEIADLEAKLGLKSSTTSEKEKKRLNKEYAKLEGYGDDFGDFLQGLDNIGRGRGSGSGSGKGYPPLDDDDSFDDDVDDDHAEDEDNGNHGGGSMHRFLANDPNNSSASSDSDDEEEEDEEEIPMKDAPIMDDDDSVMEELERMEQEERQRRQQKQKQQDEKGNKADKNDDDDEEESISEKDDGDDDDDDVKNDSNNEDDDDDKDHNAKDTYRPSQGQDIYGNTIDASTSNSDKNSAYVPPHLRNKKNTDDTANATTLSDAARQESLQIIQRALNNALNRLSQDTIIPVTQSIAQLYDSNSSRKTSKNKKNTSNNGNSHGSYCHHATSDVNGGIWIHTRNACVTGRTIVMTGLIPVYMAALAGVVHLHPQAQLAEYVLEMNVIALWKILDAERQVKTVATSSTTTAKDNDVITKEASNLCLILCYLYNFGMVHCSLLYDVIRNLIASFKEIDVELLLLILSHCGRALRTDDPLALKEIVLLVVQKQVDAGKNKKDYYYCSRVDYMVSAITDLKNNKRRKQDTAIAENTAKLRKLVGQIKSKAAAVGSSSSSGDSSLRITLSDIFHAETKGRWWKVGASWVGNQCQFQNQQGKAANNNDKNEKSDSKITDNSDIPQDKTLLKLAAKYRMNTDIRRSIFCIIMGSADCDDAFEKLVRGGMLRNKTERDTVRVLMECCANEKTFNKFYAHLANRICDYQMQCKFTFQLAFWDIFKQFDDNRDDSSGGNAARKAANMAKLLFHLVAEHGALKLNILKAIDMASHEELPENALIFLTIFFTNLLEYYDDPGLCLQLFQSAIKGAQQGSRSKKKSAERDNDDGDDGGMDHFADESEALGGSFSLFFVQVLKASPKYKKGSKFRANLKVAIKACDTDNFF